MLLSLSRARRAAGKCEIWLSCTMPCVQRATVASNADNRLAMQVCLLDLDYNLPVQVRDSALTEEGAELAALPESDVGKEYALQKMSSEGTLGEVYTKQQANDTILRLQRTGPYYKVCCLRAPESCAFLQLPVAGVAGLGCGIILVQVEAPGLVVSISRSGGLLLQWLNVLANSRSQPLSCRLGKTCGLGAASGVYSRCVPAPHAEEPGAAVQLLREGRVQTRCRVPVPARDAHLGSAGEPEHQGPVRPSPIPCIAEHPALSRCSAVNARPSMLNLLTSNP